MGAATAAIVLVPGLVSAAKTPRPQGDARTEAVHKGYRLSQHVLDYYRTAWIWIAMGPWSHRPLAQARRLP